MKQQGQKLTIWFNPWKHDKEETLWAAFALSFLEQLARKMRLLPRMWGRVRRLVRQFDWKRGWRDLVLKTVLWIAVIAIVIVVGWKVYTSGNEWASRLYDLLSDEKLNLYKSFIETGIKTGGIAAALALLVTIFGKLMPLIEDPLKADLKKYMNTPNYEDRVTFLDRFDKDFQIILDSYAGQRTIYVFIDDLDRCEVPKAADLMAALNQMISNDRHVVYIIGMDREKVAAGLAVKHEKLLDYIFASRARTGKAPSNKQLCGLEYGYEFIEKFIQLPFRVPAADSAHIDSFLKQLSPPEEKSASKPPASKRRSLKTIFSGWIDRLRMRGKKAAQGTTGGGETGGAPGSASAAGEENKARQVQIDRIIISIGPESETFKSIIKTIAPTFDNNPRRIKQFINLFRLRVFIAAGTGHFIQEPGPKAQPPLTLEQVAKFAALELRWPLFLSDVAANPVLLKSTQKAVLGERAPKTSGLEAWQQRKDLAEFMKTGCQPAAKQAGRPRPEDPWSLADVNLDKLLKVSPLVRTVSAYVPPPPPGAERLPEAGFLPSWNGLHFANAFSPPSDRLIKTPLGEIPLGTASNGFEGGMVFVALDYYLMKLPVPATTETPRDAILYDYIFRRQLDSLNLPAAMRFVEWMDPKMSNEDRAVRMIKEEWPAVKARLDDGQPCPLGLVCVRSADLNQMGQNHQVLAYGYALNEPWLTLRVYDPNSPDRDDVALEMNLADLEHAVPLSYSAGKPVFAFFRTEYKPFTPPVSAMANKEEIPMP